MKSDNLIRDLIIILTLSVILSLWYNYFAAEKPLALLREPVSIQPVSDAELLGNSPAVDTQKKYDLSAAVNSSDTTQSANKSASAHKKDSLPAGQQAAGKSAQQPNSAAALQSAQNTRTNSEKVEAKAVQYQQVLMLLKDPDVLFIDARNSHEFAEGHLPSAINIFAMEFEQNIPKVITLPREKRIVVYCGGGECELSHDVCNNLIALGFRKVYIYLGGWDDWKKNGAGKENK